MKTLCLALLPLIPLASSQAQDPVDQVCIADATVRLIYPVNACPGYSLSWNFTMNHGEVCDPCTYTGSIKVTNDASGAVLQEVFIPTILNCGTGEMPSISNPCAGAAWAYVIVTCGTCLEIIED